MLKEQSYIEKFSDEMLLKYGLNNRDKEIIKYLVTKSIDEKLYTDTKDYQHNLKHIERVISYARMIMNKMNNSSINEEILMYAALYHDIGKTIGASNKDHGLVGAEEFKKMMAGKMSSREIEIISILISQHALEEDIIDFNNYNYTLSEQQSIQLMSNILKDADALDRNRLNRPAPTGMCDINKLRTTEAKEILKITDLFNKDYNLTIIKNREKETQTKILDNYDLLDEWINSYRKLIIKKNDLINNYNLLKNIYNLQDVKIDKKNEIDNEAMFNMYNEINNIIQSQNDEQLINWIFEYNNYKNLLKNNMYHASLDPSVDVLIPTRSTQPDKAFVFAGINPINCFSMASFRSSTIFPRIGNGVGIKEIFPGTVETTLGKKYISIYKLPGKSFEEYADNNMKAPGGECVSNDEVVPEMQVSFEFNDLMKKFQDEGLYTIKKDNNEQDIISSFIETFRQQYMWQIKDLNKNPNILEEAWKILSNTIKYYCEEYHDVFEKIKTSICDDVNKYTEEFINLNGYKPDYSSEKDKIVYDKVYTSFIDKYYLKDSNNNRIGINYNYIISLKEEPLELQKEENAEYYDTQIVQAIEKKDDIDTPKKVFDQRSKSEIEVANQIKEKNMVIKQQKEQQRSLEKPKVKTLTKSPNNGNGSSSSGGFIDTLAITLITGFIAGALFMLVYSLIK